MAGARQEPVAIVGMATVFPGARDQAGFWRNVRNGVDSIREAPASRWDPVFFEAESAAPDRVYCKRGGFLDDSPGFDPIEYGVMPVAAEGAEPDQLLALEAAAAALDDAGLRERAPDPERVGVILGRGGYVTPGIARWDAYVRGAQQLVEALRTLVPGLTDQQLAAVKAEFQQQLGQPRPEQAIGLVPNLTASRVANRLDLRGPAYIVDAACASSLVAVDLARQELVSRRCDLVLAGGVHICHDITFWTVFTQLGAMSQRQQIRPFDRRADGLLAGEGIGVFALKRYADARRDGDRVYAVIHGVGVASDGRGASLMNPSVEGQVMALERAWDGCGLEPAELGLLEAHGTGTPVGDEAELTTLARVFGQQPPGAVLGSIKSQIGHAMPAAGAAGLAKAALAIHHGVLPPSLHCDEPHPLLERTRFRVIGAAESWDGRRVAGVNAFGFGGINAHLVLAEPERADRKRPRRAALVEAQPPPLAVFSASEPENLLDSPGGDGPCRLALLDPTPKRLGQARKIVARGKPWRGRKDIWFTPAGLLDEGTPVAFLFPGVEASFEVRVEGVAEHFGLPAPAEAGGSELERHGHRLIGVARLLDAALRELGVRPALVAGHSIGEWSALIAAEMVPPEALDPFIDTLAPGSLEVPDVVFAAIGCGAARTETIGEGIDGLTVTHDNCPHQAIVCGPEGGVDELLRRMRDHRVLCQKLPFRSGFHSPNLVDYLAPLQQKADEVPLQAPRLPVWSATTCEPYPPELAAVRELIIEHLVRPVRFRELIERLYGQGVRAFIQVGTGSLAGFVGDTLSDRPHLAVSAASQRRPGLEELRRAAIALWVEGAPVRLERLPGELHGASARRARTGMQLALGAPLVKLATPLALPGGGVDLGSLPAAPPAVLAELHANLQQIAEVQREVVEACYGGGDAPAGPRSSQKRLTLSTATVPELADHCFYRQPEDWPHLADRFPVVPMTMLLDLMIEAAVELAPGSVAVALEDVHAFRWCAVEPPVTTQVDAQHDGVDRVRVRIGDYALGTVVLADDYPPAPPLREQPLTNPVPAEHDARALYEHRWMFHGPAYQGVAELGPLADDGIRGTLLAIPAPGALLDNAGQLMGYWVMRRFETDRLAFPMRIDRIRFYGPAPTASARLECSVWFDSIEAVEVRTDMQLATEGGSSVWCAVDGWVDRRFETDELLWPVLQFPENNLLTTRTEAGGHVCVEHWRTAAARDLVARRYLDQADYARYEQTDTRRRRTWLLRRVVVKDAVRGLLWEEGAGPLFPIEVEVRDGADGEIHVAGPFGDGAVYVSVEHKTVAAAAVASRAPVTEAQRAELAEALAQTQQV